MIKFIGFAKRNPSWTRDDFLSYWYQQHGPRCVSARGFIQHVRKYVQYHPIPSFTDDGWDAVAELWFHDTNEVRAAFNEPDYLNLIRADELKMSRLDSVNALATSESTVWADNGGPWGLQLFSFIKRRPELSREAFDDVWATVHGPMVAGHSRVRSLVRRYLQNRLLPRDLEDPMNTGLTRPFSFDGVITAQFENIEDLKTVTRDQELGFVLHGTDRFVDLSQGLTLVRIAKVIHDAQ
jgi:hypothetical protein